MGHFGNLNQNKSRQKIVPHGVIHYTLSCRGRLFRNLSDTPHRRIYNLITLFNVFQIPIMDLVNGVYSYQYVQHIFKATKDNPNVFLGYFSIFQDEGEKKSITMHLTQRKLQNASTKISQQLDVLYSSCFPFDLFADICKSIDWEDSKGNYDCSSWITFVESLGLDISNKKLMSILSDKNKSPTCRCLTLWEHRIITKQGHSPQYQDIDDLCMKFNEIGRSDIARKMQPLLATMK